MIFIDNKYTSVYYNIINKAKSRIIAIDIYTERHHIIPKSLNGTNNSTNLVILTAREHFVCHWLLTKMVTDKNKIKMIYALYCMQCATIDQQRYFNKITSRVFARLKGKLIMSDETKQKLRLANLGKTASNETKQKLKNKIISSETRNKISQAHQGKIVSAETGRKISAAKKGKRLTEVHKTKLSVARSGSKHTQDSKSKLSVALTGRIMSDYTKIKMSNAASSRSTVICQHCNKEFSPAMYARWHGNNCKLKN